MRRETVKAVQPQEACKDYKKKKRQDNNLLEYKDESWMNMPQMEKWSIFTKVYCKLDIFSFILWSKEAFYLTTCLKINNYLTQGLGRPERLTAPSTGPLRSEGVSPSVYGV